jgi:hypothetical protein
MYLLSGCLELRGRKIVKWAIDIVTVRTRREVKIDLETTGTVTQGRVKRSDRRIMKQLFFNEIFIICNVQSIHIIKGINCQPESGIHH